MNYSLKGYLPIGPDRGRLRKNNDNERERSIFRYK